jgi:hypothetical protein
MKKLLAIAATLEMAIGAALIVDPSIVSRLLLGDDASGVAVALGRVAGIALLSLGLACWPESERLRGVTALRGLVCYNLLATIYLLYLGLVGESVGILLWPVVGLHAVLTILLARTWRTR